MGKMTREEFDEEMAAILSGTQTHRVFNKYIDSLEKVVEEKNLRIAELEMQVNTLPLSLLNTFSPIVFDNSKELHAKAKELNVYLGQLYDIDLLDCVGSRMYDLEGHRLFYFRKDFRLEKELRSLKDFAKYRQFGDNIPNLYIYGHPHKGIVYIIENMNREKKE